MDNITNDTVAGFQVTPEAVNNTDFKFEQSNFSQVPEGTFNFGDPKATVVATDVAVQRAQKWDFGLGEQSPGREVFFSDIVNGRDRLAREQHAISEGLRERQMKLRLIEETVKANGGKADESVSKAIMAMSKEDLSTPQNVESFFEQRYANKYVNSAVGHMLATAGAHSTVKEAWEGGREKTLDAMDFASKVISIKEVAQRVTEDLESRYKGSGFSAKILPNLERFIGPLFDARLKSNTFSWKGEDLTNQYSSIYTSDPETAATTIKQRAEEIYAKNPEAALEWLQGLSSYSTSDRVWGNFMTAVDLAPVTGIVPYKLASKLTGADKAAASFGRMMKGVVGAAGNRTTSVAAVHQAVGDLRGAAGVTVAQDLAKRAAGVGEDLAELVAKTPSIHNPQAIFQGPVNLAKGHADNIVNQLERGNEALQSSLEEMVRLNRQPDGSLAMQTGRAEAERIWRLENPRIAGNVVAVTPSTLEEGLTTGRFLKIQLGRQVATDVETVKGADAVVGKLEKPGGGKFQKMEFTAANTNDNGGVFSEQLNKTLIPANANAGAEGFVATKMTGDAASKALKPSNENIKTTILNHKLDVFSTREAAERAAREDYGLTKFNVVDTAGGHVIEVYKGIDETLASVRNALAIDLKESTPRLPAQMYLGRLISKDGKLSEDVMEAYKTAAYGSKGLMEALEIAAAPVRELRQAGGLFNKQGKKSWDNFVTFLDRQKLERQPNGDIGRFSTSQGEFEAEWMRNFGTNPNAAESAAYWSYVNVSNQDWVINNLGIYRDKIRSGIENFKLPNKPQANGALVDASNPMPVKDGVELKNADITLKAANETGETVIEGRFRIDLPWDSKESWNIMRWDENGNHNILSKYDIFKMGQQYRDFLDNGLKSGQLKMVHVSPEGEKVAAKALGQDERIHFIITDGNMKAETIGLQQIPYKPGGHVAYDYDWYVRQPKLKTNAGKLSSTTTYSGDLNMYGASTEKEAKVFTERMNVARQMLKNNDAGLPSYLSRNLPHSYDDFRRLFKDHGGDYDINTPFYHTPANSNVDDFHKLADTHSANNPHHQFLRSSDSEFNLYRDLNLKFASERNQPLNAVVGDHSRSNPTFQLRRSEILDPAVTMDRSAKQIMNSVYLHDLKHKSLEGYVAEFSSVLAPDISELRKDLLSALMHAPFKPDADPVAVAAAKDYRRATLELLHIKSDHQNAADSLLQRAKESILGTKAGRWVADFELPMLKDPIQYMRNAAFNLKIGMFNPSSFFQQAMIVSHITGVEGPVRAVKAGTAAMYHGLLSRTNDPAVIKHWAKQQEAVTGLRADHFLEAVEGLKRTKYGSVGREVADLGDWDSPRVLESKVGKFFEMGKIPYKMGEGVGRTVGWFAAHDHWRALNPNAKWDDKAIREVLARADLLNLNMSSVSNADWQKGILGIPTQFFSAHVRLGQQIWGRQLTPQETARVFAVNSILYGVPVAAGGLAAGIYPVGEKAKEMMLDRGIRPEDNMLTDVISNGIPQVIGRYITGMDMEFGAKYGLGGVSLLRDIFSSDKGTAELLGGVSGKALLDTLAATKPFAASVLGHATGDLYPLTSTDFTNALHNISSYSAAEKLYMAIARQEYVSKKGVRLENVSEFQGMILALTGMQPTSVADMYRMINANKGWDEYQGKKRQEYGQFMREAFKALDNGDDQGYKDYMKRASIAFVDGRFREDQRFGLLKQAIDDSATLVRRLDQKSATKYNSPERMEAWYKELKRN